MAEQFHYLLYQPIHANATYTKQFGIYSPYTVEQILADRANIEKYRISSTGEALRALSNIYTFQNEEVGIGCGGFGFQWDLIPTLLPIGSFVVLLMIVRFLMMEPLARFGLYMGVVTENKAKHAVREASGLYGSLALSRRNQKKLLKFQNQLWLAIFYILSSYFGYYVQRDKPWFTFPLNEESSLHLLLPHPWTPPTEIIIYYYYGLAFYLSELFSLVFIERRIKRSDFIEYCVHHVTTLLLMICSHIGWEHRFGAYVLFIHDASDIMLSFAKCTHYIIEENEAREERFNKRQLAEHRRHKNKGKKSNSPPRKDSEEETALQYHNTFLFRYFFIENTANVMFGLFIVIFFFFRLYCLPMMLQASFLFAAKVRHGNFNMWLLTFLLNVCLQALHVYWGLLIIKMVFSVFVNNQRKDIRSDEEEEEGEQPDGTDHPWSQPDVVLISVLEARYSKSMEDEEEERSKKKKKEN